MILSIIILLLLAGIAYFHYAQGLFASTVSAVCAAIAAFMAFSYHETLATMLAEHLGAYGAPLMLCGLFAGIYLLLRTIIDNLLPGNVRFPIALDKAGAAVMGIVAAVFATGIIAIAAQELPFGSTVAMYSTYNVEEGTVSVDRRFSRMYAVEDGDDAPVFGELVVDRLKGEAAQEERQSLWVPVDQWLVGLVSSLSDQGSLAGRNALEDVYPDFTQAIFAERLGMEPGVARVAINNAQAQTVAVPSVFQLTTEGAGAQYSGGIPQVDADARVNPRSLEPTYQPPAGKTAIVVRVLFQGDVAENGFVRFGPGNARLVAGGEQYFPIGTLEAAAVLVAHKPDDFILTPGGVDLVYEVDSDIAIEGDKLAPKSFLQFKRHARVDLGGQPLLPEVTADPQTLVLRKLALQEQIGRAVTDSTELRDWLPAWRNLVDSLQSGSTGQTATQPPTNAAEPQAQPQGQGPMGIIRNQADQRNELIEGGNQP